MKPIHLELDLLNNLTQMPGLPGREKDVARLIESYIQLIDWNTSRDSLGNVIAHKPGNGPKVLLIAHMDEVGLIVRRITKDGFLLVERLGGMGLRSLPGSRLILWTREGKLPAQVGLLPQHLDNHDYLPLSNIYIDIGAKSEEDVLSMGVRIGDGLTWDSPLKTIKKNNTKDHGYFISSKALDDRLGCFSLLMLAKYIHSQSIDLNCDLYMGFLTQEEIMLMGGQPVIHSILPDYVIGIDGTLATDTPDLLSTNSAIHLGKGPSIKILDAIRGKLASYVPDWELTEFFRSISEEHDLPLQVEISPGISTALTPIPPSLPGGVKTAGLSIPIRYHHSPIETAHLNDVQTLIAILDIFIKEFFQSFK
jgi:putative aminopeptidase